MSNRTLHLLTPNILLRAYASGIFPMAESAEATDLHWFDPPIRAVIPLDERFHVPRRLSRALRQKPYTVSLNKNFSGVIRACATAAPGRLTTWINREIVDLYCTLHWRGHAHSIEMWEGNNLVGGLYGVSLGAAFFGESMFSCRANASKIALVHLVALLRYCGFTLLDTQFQTEHLTQFGTHEITRVNYLHLLKDAAKKPVELTPPPPDVWHHLAASAGLQPVTQRS